MGTENTRNVKTRGLFGEQEVMDPVPGTRQDRSGTRRERWLFHRYASQTYMGDIDEDSSREDNSEYDSFCVAWYMEKDLQT